MSTMAVGWTMIRVREETVKWLKRECQRLADAHETGCYEVAEYGDRHGNQAGCGVSVNDLIWRMLRGRERHRERRRAARRRSTAKLRAVPDYGQ